MKLVTRVEGGVWCFDGKFGYDGKWLWRDPSVLQKYALNIVKDDGFGMIPYKLFHIKLR